MMILLALIIPLQFVFDEDGSKKKFWLPESESEA